MGHEDAKKYTGSLTGGEGGTERQGRSLTRNMARSAPIFWEEPVPVPWNFCRYHIGFAEQPIPTPAFSVNISPGYKVSID